MRDLARLLKAWLNGTYKVFPWLTLFVLILVGIYAVNPFDLIPDFIPIIGVIDDAAMLGFLVRSIMKDVRKFREWERSAADRRTAPPAEDAEFVEIKDEPKIPKGQIEEKGRM